MIGANALICDTHFGWSRKMPNKHDFNPVQNPISAEVSVASPRGGGLGGLLGGGDSVAPPATN